MFDQNPKSEICHTHLQYTHLLMSTPNSIPSRRVTIYIDIYVRVLIGANYSTSTVVASEWYMAVFILFRMQEWSAGNRHNGTSGISRFRGEVKDAIVQGILRCGTPVPISHSFGMILKQRNNKRYEPNK
jgi:hypothetical protein